MLPAASHFVIDKAALIAWTVNRAPHFPRSQSKVASKGGAPEGLFARFYNHSGTMQLTPWGSLVFLLSLPLLEFGACQRSQRLRLVPPMNATALCPSSQGHIKTQWFFPNGSRVVTAGRVTVDEDHGLLEIIDPIAEDLGVYICVSLRDPTKAGNATGVDAVLSFVEIYTSQPRTLKQRLLLGGLASLSVLVTVIFIYLVYRFRYRTPPVNEKGGVPVRDQVGVVNKRFEDEMSTVF
ncbi:hypothetical protein V5799_017664 [Amblyomma americanum]|uniref:Ig-like domain-containing protein n=2 Tax=Amblyomma americanum TaxID=6943 RepID=A0AAQ4F2K3_AMBAM